MRAPPELRTTAGGLTPPKGVSVVDVSDAVADVPEVVEVCGPVVEEVCELVVEVGDSAVSVDVEPFSEEADSEVAVVDEDVEELESVGSAPAMPGTLASAAPTPRAAANSPTRPMYSAYCSAGCSLGSGCVAGVPAGTHPPLPPGSRRTSGSAGDLTSGTA